jgi:hypothetical protein
MLEDQKTTAKVTDAHRSAEAFFDSLQSFAASGRGSLRITQPDCVPNLLSKPLNELSERLRELKPRFERPDDQFELNSLADRCEGQPAGLFAFVAKRSGYVYWLESSDERTTRSLCPIPTRTTRASTRCKRPRSRSTRFFAKTV